MLDVEGDAILSAKIHQLAPPRQPNSHLLKDEGEQKTRSSRQDEVVDLEGDLELEGLTAAVQLSAFVYAFAGGWSEWP